MKLIFSTVSLLRSFTSDYRDWYSIVFILELQTFDLDVRMGKTGKETKLEKGAEYREKGYSIFEKRFKTSLYFLDSYLLFTSPCFLQTWRWEFKASISATHSLSRLSSLQIMQQSVSILKRVHCLLITLRRINIYSFYFMLPSELRLFVQLWMTSWQTLLP